MFSKRGWNPAAGCINTNNAIIVFADSLITSHRSNQVRREQGLRLRR
jgi:hypothetical protein